jgi:hypothetical protein
MSINTAGRLVWGVVMEHNDVSFSAYRRFDGREVGGVFVELSEPLAGRSSFIAYIAASAIDVFADHRGDCSPLTNVSRLSELVTDEWREKLRAFGKDYETDVSQAAWWLHFSVG